MNKTEEVTSAKSLNDTIKKDSPIQKEREVKNEKEMTNNQLYFKNSSKETAALNDPATIKSRRSYSTTDSSSKMGLYHDTVTTRINAITVKPKKKDKIIINLKYTQYDILATVATELGYKITRTDKAEYDIIWFDLPPVSNILAKLKSFQRINHFPGVSQVANKSYLARNLNRMAKLHPNGYAFIPQTWMLPSEKHDLK